jgi:asparagine synthase (glutamine-hydrolysing)
MCGITGIVYNNSLKDTQDIQRMSDTIAHRGPDGEGFLAVSTNNGKITELGGGKTPVHLPNVSEFGANANMYLAHRRLSIIDLSKAGHQPMANKNKDIWVTFNGEIYNYKSLRNELSEYNFVSNTDTEVLIYAYEKWGINCLKRFNGMWAFVLYDKKKNILFGARDRFGVKPLYYTQNADFFAFNSEIKGLLAKPEVPRKVNISASSAYLRTGLETFTGETFFDAISELQPSHYFIYDLENKKLSIEKYYELEFCDTWEQYDEKKSKEYIEGVKDRIIQAVDLRLNADVTVGSCLSGGMDSSAIVCAINKLLKNKSYESIGPKQGVVTACYNDSPIDESAWAKHVVDHVSADWHKVFPKREEMESDLSDLIYTQDVPFGSTSIYAQYRVMKTAREAGLTVMLDGQGGDELFTGYTPYYHTFYSEAKKNKDYNLLSTEQEYVKNTPFGDINIDKMITKHDVTFSLRKFIPKRIKDILRPYIRKTVNESTYIEINGKQYKQYSYTTLNQMLYTLMAYVSLPTLLKYEDRNSMRFSIESRTPFADDIELINYTFAIPGVYKIHNGWSKYLLRESMSGIVPAQIKERTDKIGFATPEYEWLQSIKSYLFDNINSDIKKIINISKLEKDWDTFLSKQNKMGITEIWRYINYILWFKTFKVNV